MNEDYKIYKLNAYPSEPDPLDYKVTKLVPLMTVFPEEYLIKYNGITKDQGNVGCCVAESLSYTREIQEEKQSGNFKYFSEGFIYSNRLEKHLKEPGMIPAQALYALRHYGTVLKSDFPQIAEYPEILSEFDLVKENLMLKAKKYCISSYCRVRTEQEFKTALIRIGPVTACFPIYDSFYKTDKRNPIAPIPTSKDQFMGYHEMTILGYDKYNNRIVLNSWGDKWCKNGYCFIPPQYPIEEMWSITDNIMPHPEGNDNKFYRLVVKKYFNLKDSAYIFLETIKAKGFNDAVVDFNEEYEFYEICLATDFDKYSPKLTDLQRKIELIGLRTNIILK